MGNTTLIVSPALSAPLALELNCAVHVTPVVFAARVVAEKVTAVGAVAAVMVTLPAGLAGVVSALVLTVQLARRSRHLRAVGDAGDRDVAAVVAGGETQVLVRVMVSVGPVVLPLVLLVVLAGLVQVPV